MTSTLSESTEVSKLAKQIITLKADIAESKTVIEAKDTALNEAKRSVRVANDLNERKAIMSEMLGPLNKGQKELMGTLLESVKTVKLKAAYKKYLPSVLTEGTTPQVRTKNKAKLTESSTKVVAGNKVKTSAQSETGGSADIIELKKLAGLS